MIRWVTSRYAGGMFVVFGLPAAGVVMGVFDTPWGGMACCGVIAGFATMVDLILDLSAPVEDKRQEKPPTRPETF